MTAKRTRRTSDKKTSQRGVRTTRPADSAALGRGVLAAREGASVRKDGVPAALAFRGGLGRRRRNTTPGFAIRVVHDGCSVSRAAVGAFRGPVRAEFHT